MAANRMLSAISTHMAMHPPHGMAGAIRLPKESFAPMGEQGQGGMAGVLDRMTGSPLGQIGLALLAGGGGGLGNAAAMLMQQGAYSRLAQMQMAPRVEHIGNQVGLLDPRTGSFTPTYTEPEQPDEDTRLLQHAHIDPNSPEGVQAYNDILTHKRDPNITIPLGDGRVYYGPQSQAQAVLSGLSGQPQAQAPTSAPASPAPATAPGGLAPRGLRNNNPLNLTLSPFTKSQAGFTGTDSGGRYATFDNPQDGLTAANHLLQSYAARGLNTPSSIIGRWSPASENGVGTTNYANYVANRLGIGPNDVVPPNRYGELISAMSDFENGRSGSITRDMLPGNGGASSGDIITQAQQAIAAGADPAAVRARALSMGVTLP